MYAFWRHILAIWNMKIITFPNSCILPLSSCINITFIAVRAGAIHFRTKKYWFLHNGVNVRIGLVSLVRLVPSWASRILTNTRGVVTECREKCLSCLNTASTIWMRNTTLSLLCIFAISKRLESFIISMRLARRRLVPIFVIRLLPWSFGVILVERRGVFTAVGTCLAWAKLRSTDALRGWERTPSVFTIVLSQVLTYTPNVGGRILDGMAFSSIKKRSDFVRVIIATRSVFLTPWRSGTQSGDKINPSLYVSKASLKRLNPTRAPPRRTNEAVHFGRRLKHFSPSLNAVVKNLCATGTLVLSEANLSEANPLW